jgi:hypothetical protein
MNGFIFIFPFQNEKDLNGIPKIALRKSGTKAYRKICGLRLNSNFFSRYVIPEISSRGSRGKTMDSRQQSAGMTPREAALSLTLSPEFIEGPVLSLSKDRRVASLYLC